MARQSKHLLILGPKCLMHFSAEMSRVRSVLGPKCPYTVLNYY